MIKCASRLKRMLCIVSFAMFYLLPSILSPQLVAQDGTTNENAEVDSARFIEAVIEQSPDDTALRQAVWHAPFAKGEFFTGIASPGAAYAVLSSDFGFDPIWNLAPRTPVQWRSGALHYMRGEQGFDGAAPKQEAFREYTNHFPGFHAHMKHQPPEGFPEGDMPWDVMHSPTLMPGSAIATLRFRRKLIEDDKRAYRTELGLTSPDGLETLLEVTNLADSPRTSPYGRGMLQTLALRQFPGADEKSQLLFYRIDSVGMGRVKLSDKPIATYPENASGIISRPVWISAQTFAVIRANTLNEAKTHYSNAELQLVTLDPTGKAHVTRLARGNFPVETACDPILYNDRERTLAVLTRTGEHTRKITLFGFPPEGAMQEITSTAEFSALQGMWREEGGFGLVINSRIYRLSAEKGLEATSKGAPRISVDGSTTIAVKDLGGFGKPGFVAFGMPKTGDGFPRSVWATYTGVPAADSDAAQILHSQKLQTHMPESNWIRENSKAAKAIAEVGDDLENTVIAYDITAHVETKAIKSGSAKMLELYQSYGERLRLEDDFNQSWIIKAWDGKQAYLTNDQRKEFLETKGDTADTLKAHLNLRRMMLLSNIRAKGPKALVPVRRQQISVPDVNAASGRRSIDTIVYTRVDTARTADSAYYWFDATGKDHNLVKATLRFGLVSDDSRPQAIELYFSGFGPLRNLSDRAAPSLQIPYTIEGFTPQSGERRFTMKFLPRLRRESFADGRREIESGYNAEYLSRSDFESNYRLDS